MPETDAGIHKKSTRKANFASIYVYWNIKTFDVRFELMCRFRVSKQYLASICWIYISYSVFCYSCVWDEEPFIVLCSQIINKKRMISIDTFVLIFGMAVIFNYVALTLICGKYRTKTKYFVHPSICQLNFIYYWNVWFKFPFNNFHKFSLYLNHPA